MRKIIAFVLSMVTMSAMAQRVIDVHSHIITPEFVSALEEEAQLKPRLVVCTDIAPGDIEPDDMESMVRLMAYADCFEIEALITTVGWNCDPYPKEWKAAAVLS